MKRIDWPLLMCYEHAARALIELLQIGKIPSGPDLLRFQRYFLRSLRYWSRQTLESNISAQGLCARQDVGYRRILPSCSIL